MLWRTCPWLMMWRHILPSWTRPENKLGHYKAWELTFLCEQIPRVLISDGDIPQLEQESWSTGHSPKRSCHHVTKSQISANSGCRCLVWSQPSPTHQGSQSCLSLPSSSCAYCMAMQMMKGSSALWGSITQASELVFPLLLCQTSWGAKSTISARPSCYQWQPPMEMLKSARLASWLQCEEALAHVTYFLGNSGQAMQQYVHYIVKWSSLYRAVVVLFCFEGGVNSPCLLFNRTKKLTSSMTWWLKTISF